MKNWASRFIPQTRSRTVTCSASSTGTSGNGNTKPFVFRVDLLSLYFIDSYTHPHVNCWTNSQPFGRLPVFAQHLLAAVHQWRVHTKMGPATCSDAVSGEIINHWVPQNEFVRKCLTGEDESAAADFNARRHAIVFGEMDDPLPYSFHRHPMRSWGCLALVDRFLDNQT